MARFTQYPTASTGDYADATTFLIANSDGEIKQASLEGLRSTFFCSTQCVSVTITSAEILALNTTPKEIIPAQGAGTVIEVISMVAKVSNVTTPYATNTTFQLTNGGDAPLAQSLSLLTSTVDKIGQYPDTENPSAGQTQLIENTAVTATVQSGNPTAGDGDIEVFVLYRVITV